MSQAAQKRVGRDKPTSARRKTALLVACAVAGFLSACNVGPQYHKPSIETPPQYKELNPQTTNETAVWKEAQPSDALIRDKWWEIYNDPLLNSLEDKVDVSNQNIAQAYANFLSERAMVKEARSQYYPQISFGPQATVGQPSANVGSSSSNNNSTTGTSGATGTGAGSTSTTPIVQTTTNRTEGLISLPFDASWTPDLFDRIRNTVRAAQYGAQASAADLEDVRLVAHADLAVDYFELRGQDTLKKLFDDTVTAYQESLHINQVLYNTGIQNQEVVAQAETQLDTAKAQDINLAIARAQYEHAIAVLIGQPASTFSVPVNPVTITPPPIPVGVPSQLLERRPDIAQAERTVAQGNATIGVGRAAYFPELTISASAGFESTSFAHLLAWSSRFWSVGPSISQTIYDGGLRRATVQQYIAQYQSDVASYREVVLSAFQNVEDQLAALRILSEEIVQQDDAVKASQNYLTIATNRFKLGLDPYLDVISAQTTLFTNEQTAATLRTQAIDANVQLIEALGGGWDNSQLPSPNSSTIKNPPQLAPHP